MTKPYRDPWPVSAGDRDSIFQATVLAETILLITEVRNRNPRGPGFHTLSNARATVIQRGMKEISHDLIIVALTGLAGSDIPRTALAMSTYCAYEDCGNEVARAGGLCEECRTRGGIA